MAVAPHTFSEDAACGRSRSMSRSKWAALIGGGALAIYGITRRSPLGIALAATGGTVALLGTKRKSSEDQGSVWTSVLVNCTPAEAYRFWQNLQDLPLFMNRIQTVSVLDDRHSRWTAIGPMGTPIQWEAEITDRHENEFIEWRSLPGSDVQVNGRVEFQSAPADRGTLIRARIDYAPVPGMSPLAKFLNRGANFAMRQDLRRLEALMETGEIPTTEGQSHGPRDVVTGLFRVADPTRPLPSGSRLKDAFTARRSVA